MQSQAERSLLSRKEMRYENSRKVRNSVDSKKLKSNGGKPKFRKFKEQSINSVASNGNPSLTEAHLASDLKGQMQQK